jgi:HTH-type transcriptional regulator/antitoxin HigA
LRAWRRYLRPTGHHEFIDVTEVQYGAELKPIRTAADYERALAEVARLWGAKVGTPRGDRLDVLATLIDAYEALHHPMDPPDPIEAIRFRMEQQGLICQGP